MSRENILYQTGSNSNNRVARPLEIISQLFDYYRDREGSLVKLCYQLGATTGEVAEAMDVDPSLISHTFPKDKLSRRTLRVKKEIK